MVAIRFFTPLLRRLAERAALSASARPIPAEWDTIVDARVPYIAALPHGERRQLLQHARDLLATPTWEGCGGLELTDEMRLIIAAQAAILTWKRTEAPPFPRLRSVLVYPSTFHPKPPFSWVADPSAERDHPTLGESWSDGTVILAWDEVVHGAALPHDGHNVVLHEFAHQLDSADGLEDGVPLLDESAESEAWERTLLAAYHQFEEEAVSGRSSPMDHYGLTNRAEFFAVATESFFERPEALRAGYPELYDQLAAFYAQDPATTTSSD